MTELTELTESNDKRLIGIRFRDETPIYPLSRSQRLSGYTLSD